MHGAHWPGTTETSLPPESPPHLRIPLACTCTKSTIPTKSCVWHPPSLMVNVLECP